MNAAPKSFWTRYGKWLVLALVLIAFATAWSLLPVKEWVKAFNGWIEQRGAWGYVIFIAAYAVAAVLFFPGSLLTIGAGLALSGFGAVSRSSRQARPSARRSRFSSRAIFFFRHRVEEAAKNNPKFAVMDEAIGREGWKMVALLRLSPLVPVQPQQLSLRRDEDWLLALRCGELGWDAARHFSLRLSRRCGQRGDERRGRGTLEMGALWRRARSHDRRHRLDFTRREEGHALQELVRPI